MIYEILSLLFITKGGEMDSEKREREREKERERERERERESRTAKIFTKL